MTQSFPVLPLRDIVVFPQMIVPLFVGRDSEEARDEAVRALEAALEGYQAEGREFPMPRACGTCSVTTTRFGELTPA